MFAGYKYELLHCMLTDPNTKSSQTGTIIQKIKLIHQNKKY